MEKLPKSVRDSLARQQGVDTHPDADLLTAFGEGAATERERQMVLAHLAVCAECREVVALALPEVAPQTVVTPERRGWARRWMWVPAVGAVAVVAISASLLLNREQANREQLSRATETTGVARQKSVDQVAASPYAQTPSAAMADAATKPAANDRGRDEKRAHENALASSPAKTAEKKAKDVSPDLLAKRAEADKADIGQAIHGTMTQPQHPEIGAATQTVEVTAAAPLVDVNPANAPAAMPTQPARRPAASDYRAMGGVLGGTVNSAARGGPFTQNQSTQNQNSANESVNTANAAPRERAKKENAPPPGPPPVPSTAGRIDVTTSKVQTSNMAADWRIDADGHLQRSFGAGGYTPVMSDIQTVFRAMSVNGTDVWAGGNAGALYHSSDNGASWKRIEVRDGAKKVTTNIIGVRFQDTERGVIKTESGQSWTTKDGGDTWNEIR